MTIFGRQPAVWIGIIVAVVIAVVQALSGQGLISDALAGKVTDTVTAIAQLLQLLAPIIAGLVIKTQVTPTSAPVLPSGTAVTTPTGQAATVTATPVAPVKP